MRARLSQFVLILAACALSACVSMPPDHVALDARARDNVQSTDVVAPVRQGEIYVFVPQTNSAGQGLLGVAIAAGVDAVRTSNAEQAVKPLRDAIIDLNFDDLLREDLKASMSQVQWLHVNDVKVIKDVATASLDGAITDSKAGAVLMADADYHLSTDGGTLYIIINANLFPNSPVLTPPKAPDADSKPKSDRNNAIYRNAFMFEARLPARHRNPSPQHGHLGRQPRRADARDHDQGRGETDGAHGHRYPGSPLGRSRTGQGRQRAQRRA